ncbi:sel1 repeat family protein [Leucothrix sargassi]|nr:sel1 repeat family protein [Leucothrix sargassi]
MSISLYLTIPGEASTVNEANNARVCKIFLQFDENNAEHANVKKLTDTYISTQSYEQALGLFLKLAKKGDRFFQHNAGVLLQCIESVRDYDSAYHWFRASVEQDYAPAKERLGCMYEFGDGNVKVDTRRALTLYSESASQGYIHSIYNIGMILSEGNDTVPRDPKAGKELLIQAAVEGHALMKLNLGLLYLADPKLKQEAPVWFERAVQQDSLVAIDLGLWFLESADAHPHNAQLSHYWFGVALALGHEQEVNLALSQGDEPIAQSFSYEETVH